MSEEKERQQRDEPQHVQHAREIERNAKEDGSMAAEEQAKHELNELYIHGKVTDKLGVLREDQATDRHYRWYHGKNKEVAKEVYLYHKAGLFERHGYVPWWLHAVQIGLVIWGVYYLIAYWNPD